MNIGGIMKNAPNAIIWAVTLCFLGVVGAFVYLATTGADSSDFRSFINTVFNLASVLLSGGAFIAAGAAAKSAGKAEDQTNGQLDKRIQDGARQALIQHERHTR